MKVLHDFSKITKLCHTPKMSL